MALKVLEIDVAEKIPALLSHRPYEGIHILVKYRRQPVGWVTLGNLQEPANPEQLREAIAEELGESLVRAALGRHLQPISSDKVDTLPISVIVCTRDRTAQLRRCLQSLVELEYPNYEIIVVDNAPSSDDTAGLAAGMPVRYVCEERPGLDRARNRGIAEALYGIVAFTDDDALPDRNWLNAISSAFAKREVMAVTGPVIPGELETDAQILFELGYGGMGHGFRERTIRPQTITLRDLFWSSGFGVGCNMAFRREIFTSVGLFDVVLDVGTPSMGAGDIEMFHRIVARGHTLVYEPTVLVRHIHRRGIEALRRQLLHNGSGFGCYLFSCARNRTLSRRAILFFACREWFWRWILRRLFRPGFIPRRLIVAELAGMLSSPVAYLASRRSSSRGR
ncbi:MAG: glycosyltransferase [Desulfobacteraceae bacterium]|nr:MAG: glycosyltransferase [Desulfobacteraceae bacterium]